MQIGFVGLGKLGLPVALAINSKGHSVVGYDIDSKVRNYLEQRAIPYKEEGAAELLATHTVRWDLLDEVVKESEIVFIPIQTPHNPRYEGVTRLPDDRVDFDYSYLIEGVKRVAESCKRQQKTTVVAIISTVLPGTIDREIRPLLNEFTKLVYTPQFIAMGTTIRDFLNPEFTLLGVDDEEAATKVIELVSTLHQKPVFKTAIKNAELIKVAYNTFISTKIAYINTIMEVCHKLGCDVDAVTTALSLSTDRIISSKYLRGGMGDGGGCHPRDNIAMSYLAKKVGLSFDFFNAIMLARENQTVWLAKMVYRAARDTELPIVILGESFKPETNITTGSPAVLLQNLIHETNIKCEIYDPFIDSGDAPNHTAVYFIATQHEVFKGYKFPKGSVVIDPFRYIPNQDNVQIIHIGGGDAA